MPVNQHDPQPLPTSTLSSQPPHHDNDNDDSDVEKTLPPPPPHLVHLLVDTHAHPADDPCTFSPPDATPRSPEEVAAAVASQLATCPLRTIVAMSTSLRDIPIVHSLASSSSSSSSSAEGGCTILPAFGLHPWFAHTVSLEDVQPDKRTHYTALFAGQKGAEDELEEILDQLPEPVLLSELLARVREGMEAFPNAMLGEVGIDRAFRIPRKVWSYDPHASSSTSTAAAGTAAEGECCTPSTTDHNALKPENERKPNPSPRLTRLKTPLPHQLTLVKSQINLAISLGRNISFHSVQAAGATLTLLRELHLEFSTPPLRMGDINLSLHSCTLDAAVVRSLLSTYPDGLYVGFSTGICKSRGKWEETLEAVGRERMLAESDHHTLQHMPGRLWEAVGEVARLWFPHLQGEGKGEEEGQRKTAQQLYENWRRFCRNRVGGDDDDEDDDGDDEESEG